MSLLLVVTVVVFALSAFPGQAAAHDVIDQAQEFQQGYFWADVYTTTLHGQTFTPAHTGPLSKVSLAIFSQATGSYDIKVQICTLPLFREPAPDKILATSVVHITGPVPYFTWQDFTFSSPPNVTAGTQYAIVISSGASTAVNGDRLCIFFSSANPYTAGARILWGAWSNVDYWYTPPASPSWDLVFRTYYQIPDTTPPSVTPPADITVDVSGSDGTVVTFGASATDPEDGILPASAIAYYTDYETAPTRVYSGITGFPVGTTTVTAEAKDSHGNIGTATFTVSVVADTTPPTVTPPDNLTVEAVSSAGAEASFGSASASDNVDGAMPATSIHYYSGYGTDDQAEVYSGDLFPIGTTTVTVAATDAHNNTGTATFSVSVVDTTAPALTVPADITVDANVPAGATVSFSVSATDLVDGAVTPLTAPVSGVTFPIGETTVWVSATDSAGNTTTDTFLVTVVGPTGMLDALAGTIVEAPDDPTAPGGIAPLIEESLLVKVNAALAALARGNKNDAKVAMNDLKALINEVKAQTSKSISPEAAAAIIAAANGLINVLGAPASTLPMTTGAFAGPDSNDTEWQVQMNVVGSAFDPENPYNTLAAGTISFAASQTLPDGTRVEKTFTMTVDCHYSIDYFPSGDLVDAGAAVGICGFVVASTGGEGVPAVGDYYLFLAWDGAQGYQNPDGTMGYYPDTWTFAPWGGATYMRNFQRAILGVLGTYGSSYYYPYVGSMNLWPVTEGDISVTGGVVF